MENPYGLGRRRKNNAPISKPISNMFWFIILLPWCYFVDPSPRLLSCNFYAPEYLGWWGEMFYPSETWHKWQHVSAHPIPKPISRGWGFPVIGPAAP